MKVPKPVSEMTEEERGAFARKIIETMQASLRDEGPRRQVDAAGPAGDV